MEDLRGLAKRSGGQSPSSAAQVNQALSEISTVICESGQVCSGDILNQLKRAIDGVVHNDQRMYHNDELIVI